MPGGWTPFASTRAALWKAKYCIQHAHNIAMRTTTLDQGPIAQW